MIIEYTPAGQITHIINDPVPETVIAGMRERGSTFIETPIGQQVDISKDYVAEGAIHSRPTIDIEKTYQAPVGAEIVIAGLPLNCRCIIDGQEIVVPDGELILESDHPATYGVLIDHFPYLRVYSEVTFHAA